MRAAPVELAAPDALLEVSEPPDGEDPEPDVEVGLEPEEPEEPEDPDEPDEPAPPLVLLPPEVLLPPLEPPLGVVELPKGLVPFPATAEGTTMGTTVVLGPAGTVSATVWEVMTDGWVVTAVGWVVTAVGWVVTAVG